LALSNELGYKRERRIGNLILGSIKGTTDLGESIQHGVTALSNLRILKMMLVSPQLMHYCSAIPGFG
jgi:hypothetical protein